MSKLVYHFLLEKSIGMQIIYQTNLCLKYNTVQKAYIFIGFLLSDFKLSVHEKVTKSFLILSGNYGRIIQREIAPILEPKRRKGEKRWSLSILCGRPLSVS